MDRIGKALQRLTPAERGRIKHILRKLADGDLTNLDIKKLRDRNDIYRVRKGDIRIIYRVRDANEIFILAVERRGENTYRKI